MDRSLIGPALGKITSGIFVLTARMEGEPVGMLASFVEQASFEPPMVTVSIGLTRPLLAAAEAGSLLGLNILAKSDGKLVGPFVKKHGAAAFEGLSLLENPHAVPWLADAWAVLALKPVAFLDAGDHRVVLTEVLDGRLLRETEEPMIRVRPDGFGY